MEYRDYEAAVQRAAELSRAGDQGGAGGVFLQLAAEPSLTDMDRAIMLFNASQCLQQVAPAEEIERIYDAAIAIERKWCRERSREAKANWLAGVGRTEEAVALYTELMAEPWVTMGQRRGYEEAIFRIRR